MLCFNLCRYCLGIYQVAKTWRQPSHGRWYQLFPWCIRVISFFRRWNQRHHARLYDDWGELLFSGPLADRVELFANLLSALNAINFELQLSYGPVFVCCSLGLTQNPCTGWKWDLWQRYWINMLLLSEACVSQFLSFIELRELLN